MRQDAKLTTRQRKNLKGTSFCGPERSFPVPDCKHVKAALSLLGRYTGPGDKAKIRACIYGKAKAMKCFAATDFMFDAELERLAQAGEDEMTGIELITLITDIAASAKLKPTVTAIAIGMAERGKAQGALRAIRNSVIGVR